MKTQENAMKTSQKNSKTTSKMGDRLRVRYLTMTAMLSAISFILMFFQFSIPFVPSFVKMDLSELPALIGAFAMGPVYGILICLIKNVFHLMVTSTGGVGELSNFILGAAFVLPAGILYKIKKTRGMALLGSLVGAVFMAVLSVISNYFIVYPIYTAFMPMSTILHMYQIIWPGADTLLKCLIVFNMPFTFIKGILSVIITLLVYKHISPIIHGADK